MMSFRRGLTPFSPTPHSAPTVYRGAAGEVSQIVCLADCLIAGTDRGEVLRWKADAPETPAEEVLHKEHGIYGLALVYLDGWAHLAVGAKEANVTALRLDDLTVKIFRTPRWPAAFVAGASDFLAAIDADRASLCLWDTSAPAKPAMTVAVRPITGHSIQDLVCWREPGAAGKA